MENRYLQVLRGTVALNSNLVLFALCKNVFGLHMKFDKGGNSLPKHFEHNPNIRSNFFFPRNQTNKKQSLQLGRICFRILGDSWRILASFAKFFVNRFSQRELELSSLSHTYFFSQNESLQTPPLVRSFSCASEVARSPH